MQQGGAAPGGQASPACPVPPAGGAPRLAICYWPSCERPRRGLPRPRRSSLSSASLQGARRLSASTSG
eukprot:7919831-Lingulodinium_polyedra.AAC.1